MFSRPCIRSIASLAHAEIYAPAVCPSPITPCNITAPPWAPAPKGRARARAPHPPCPNCPALLECHPQGLINPFDCRFLAPAPQGVRIVIPAPHSSLL